MAFFKDQKQEPLPKAVAEPKIPELYHRALETVAKLMPEIDREVFRAGLDLDGTEKRKAFEAAWEADRKIDEVFEGIDEQLLKLRTAPDLPSAKVYQKRVFEGCGWIVSRVRKLTRKYGMREQNPHPECEAVPCRWLIFEDMRQVCDKMRTPVFDMNECPDRRWFRAGREETI